MVFGESLAHDAPQVLQAPPGSILLPGLQPLAAQPDDLPPEQIHGPLPAHLGRNELEGLTHRIKAHDSPIISAERSEGRLMHIHQRPPGTLSTGPGADVAVIRSSETSPIR
jgi:hypothetical protein